MTSSAASIISSFISPMISFGESWTISNQQSPHLTCIEVSTSGPWIVSASEDGTILFVDIGMGLPVGILDFESHMFALCVLWRTASSFFLGCSNGVVYEAILNPRNALHPISMYPIIGPLANQIRSIAFDSSGLHGILAIGHGTRVSIYAQTLPGHDWTKIDDVLEPCHERAGLVNALLFFGRSERKLFIGYAEEGWSILRYGASSETQRIDPKHYSGVCRIGQARLSPDHQTLSISTLDQSIVTYAMGDNGPILDSAREFPLQVPLAYNPILPVAHSSLDLVLGGTSIGNIPIVKSSRAAVPRLHQGDGHLIRCITPRNDDIFVGSTGPNGEVMIKCFSCKGRIVRPTWMRASGNQAPFRITLADALVMSTEAHKRTAAPLAMDQNRITQFLQSWDVKIFIGVASVLFMLVLSSDPPGGSSFQAAQIPSTKKGVIVAEED
ncbi:hypothetical protein FS749_011577 [Ceratobasidium sp. UAMH 11750]|nr:hypothetical protein FS749_011577 [Ceratobasidium sp. UAMH 11750]